ncbi:hypothetical protein EJP67_33190 [Variovorax guangxiensis]|uniref:Uncharacterized protein n=1 Tax=Variovorax guangxiensis TaxID=1775474 RepID=A0A3S0XL78_9BURK|nr:hypothetical protein [Variovorax guangxiensis]RUR71914.1 hypothetical protein EJP67_33190 [Variovorax guangxiensis]
MIPTIRAIGASLAVLICTGCVSLQQTEDQVAVRHPGDRIIDELRPFAPEAKRHLAYAWLSQSAYEKTEAAKKDPDSCQDADQALDAIKWSRWKDFPNDTHLRDEILGNHLRVEV